MSIVSTIIDWLTANQSEILSILFTSTKYVLLTFVFLYANFAYFYAWKQWNVHFGGKRVTRRDKSSPSNAQPPKVVSFEDNKGQILAAAEKLGQDDDPVLQ